MAWISQGAQFAAVFVFLFACVASLSVLAAVNAGRLAQDLPRPLKLAMWGHRAGSRPSLAGAIYAVILIACAQIVPIAALLAPAWNVGIPARLAALGFLVAEIGWFAYLRRHVVDERR